MEEGYIEYKNKYRELHRTDGPAVDNNFGAEKEYWIDGIRITEEGFKAMDRSNKLNKLLNKEEQTFDINNYKYYNDDEEYYIFE